jgi:hypothetical protein
MENPPQKSKPKKTMITKIYLPKPDVIILLANFLYFLTGKFMTLGIFVIDKIIFNSSVFLPNNFLYRLISNKTCLLLY